MACMPVAMMNSMQAQGQPRETSVSDESIKVRGPVFGKIVVVVPDS